MPAQPITIAPAPSSSFSARPTSIIFASVSFAGGGFRDAHVERTLAGEPVHQSHLAQIAQMAADRALRDRDDAEGLGAGQRGQHAAFGDAEHRPVVPSRQTCRPGSL